MGKVIRWICFLGISGSIACLVFVMCKPAGPIKLLTHFGGIVILSLLVFFFFTQDDLWVNGFCRKWLGRVLKFKWLVWLFNQLLSRPATLIQRLKPTEDPTTSEEEFSEPPIPTNWE